MKALGWGGVVVTMLTSTLGASDFSLKELPAGADGLRRFALTSPYQPEATMLRILAAEKSATGEDRRIVFILPVEAKEEHRFGDGMTEAQKLKLQEKYNVVVVAPSFAQLPWYADNPADKAIQQESHFIKAIVPAVDQLYPSKTPRRLLLGFSKSGWGGYSLILRHPDLFVAASAWDAPLTKVKPDQFGMGSIFGSQENFERYQISKLFEQKGKPFAEKKRLVLTGYGNFRQHTQDAHALMQKFGIQHEYADGPYCKHLWGSGWMEESMQLLDGLTK
ncbi:MAG TPA: hypothetical protein VGP72_19750 [Planctomycetota bacterium]|jgi:hypothetical protein